MGKSRHDLPHTIDWQLERVDADGDGYLVDVQVHYDIEPYVPARIGGPPEDCYPAEGGYINEMAVVRPGTAEPVEITDSERDAITDWIEQHHDHNADAEAAAERASDAYYAGDRDFSPPYEP